MDGCCCDLGLLNKIGPLINEIHDENSRVIATCILMALLKYLGDNYSDYVIDVDLQNRDLIITKRGGNSKVLTLPIDDYVVGALVDGNMLILTRVGGGTVSVDLSSIIPNIDTSRFFTNCELDGKTLRFYHNNTEVDHVDLKDGMLTSVVLNQLNELVFTWNSDSGISEKVIPLGGLSTSDTYISLGDIVYDAVNGTYTIKLSYNDNRLPIEMDLSLFKNDIMLSIPFVPGYFWSNERPTNGHISSSANISYLGTDLRDTAPYDFGNHRYILYANNANAYTLIDYLKEPPIDKYLLFSSYSSSIGKNDAVGIPAAYLYLAFMKKGTNSSDYSNEDEFLVHKLGVTNILYRAHKIRVSYSNNQYSYSTASNDYIDEANILSTHTSLVDSMFAKFDNFTKSSDFGQNGYVLNIFYHELLDNGLSTNANKYIDVDADNYRLFTYTNAHHTLLDANTAPNDLRDVILLKSRFCNFINPDDRIVVNNELIDNLTITIPNMATRSSKLFSINSEVIDFKEVNNSPTDEIINIKTIVKATISGLDRYFLIHGFLVILVDGTKEISLPITLNGVKASNSSDNIYSYTSFYKNYAPKSAKKDSDFYRNVQALRTYISSTHSGIYKKSYEHDPVSDIVLPENIIWTKVDNENEISFSAFNDNIVVNNGEYNWTYAHLDRWYYTDILDNNTIKPDFKNLDTIWTCLLGELFKSTYLNGGTEAVPFNSDYIDTLGWNNKYLIYALGISGLNKVDLSFLASGLSFNTNTKELESLCVITFSFVSQYAVVSGSISVTLGSYNYYIGTGVSGYGTNGDVYNFAIGPNLGDTYENFTRVFPKVTVRSIQAVGWEVAGSATAVSIKGSRP